MELSWIYYIDFLKENKPQYFQQENAVIIKLSGTW